MNNKKHIVRVAPSPTGMLHIGTLRTMYFNWLIANQNDDSKLILRIDDTDLSRSMDSMIKPIYDTIGVYGLHYDITFKQSDNFATYKMFADKLVLDGYADYDDGAIRLTNTFGYDVNMNLDWKDTITGDKKCTPDVFAAASTQVIMKSDGSPTYNFASAIDDMTHGVTWVVRGTDHIVNTFKQIIFYRLFDKPIPLHSHVGLLCDISSGKKYSKRDSDLLDLSKYNVDAVLNFILRLGWSPTKDDKSNNIIPRDKAIKMFLADGKMRAPNCKVDLNKLDWYNKKYNGFNI
tara:strand:- start:1284 stop:2153 length:870 start_codon:yes stop_codon:yes gene_type:complete